MRAIGNWASGFLRFIGNILVFMLVILPAYAVVGVLWFLYVIVICVALGILAGWGLYVLYPPLWLSIGGGLFVVILYWYTIWYINDKTGWPFRSGEKVFEAYLNFVPDFY